MITLTFEPTCPEQAALLGKFLPEYMAAGSLVVSGEPQEIKTVVERAAEIVDTEKAAAKKPRKPAATPAASEAAPVEAAAPAPAAASPSEVTLEQVRAKLASLSQAGKAADVKALIATFGASKLTDIAAEKYADVLAAAEEIA